MVTGPGTASEWMARDLSKGKAPPNQILLVEVAESGIDWREPRDFTLEEILEALNSPDGRGISSFHFRPHVLTAHGTVYSLPETTSDEALDALLTKDLSDAAIKELLDERGPERTSWRRVSTHDAVRLALAWFLGLIVLLVDGVIVYAWRGRYRASETPSSATEAEPNQEPADPDRPDQ
jgi:hypothetical protein